MTIREPAVSADQTLNALVQTHPTALPVLTRFGLDTCCGGALTLREAARHHDLDLDELLGAVRLTLAS